MQRNYQTVDVILTAAENQTVEIIKSAADTSIGILPVVAGAIVTLIGLCLHLVVKRYWPSAKEELCLTGQNPTSMPVCCLTVSVCARPGRSSELRRG